METLTLGQTENAHLVRGSIAFGITSVLYISHFVEILGQLCNTELLHEGQYYTLL